MLVDSSVWIDFFGQLQTQPAQRVFDALKKGKSAFVTETIFQEVLQGARSPEHYLQLREQLMLLPLVPVDDSRELHAQAAMLYARCRWRGITVRSPNDCLIAVAAIEHSMPLLTLDKDFLAIARIEPALKLA